jgi:hypothetical protein
MTLVGYKGENDIQTGVVLVCYKEQDVFQGEQIDENQYKILIGSRNACFG